MERALYRLLNQERTREVTLRGQRLTMTLLNAQELLEMRLSERSEDDDFSNALHTNATLITKSLRSEGTPVFECAEEVLNTLSTEEINAVVAAYRRWSAEIDPGFGSGEETIEALKKA